MQSVHLVGEEEDELYSGFNDYNEAFDTEVNVILIESDCNLFFCWLNKLKCLIRYVAENWNPYKL